MIVSPIGNSGNYSANQERHSRRIEWNELWSFPPRKTLGQHKIDIGTSVAHTGDEGHWQAKRVMLSDAAGVKLRTIDFVGGSPFEKNDLQTAVFAQDHWSLNSHFALDPGLRIESQSITGTLRIAPRLGALWSPDANERTVLRGGVGLFYDSVPLHVYAFTQYPEQIITSYLPNGAVDGNPERYQNLIATGSDFPLIDRDRKTGGFAPYSIAWNLEIERQFSNRLKVRARYLESETNGLTTISPELLGSERAYVIDGSGSSHYRQFELTAKMNFQSNFPIYASYVRSLSKGVLNESDTYLGDFSMPFIRSSVYGTRSGDVPNRFLLWGSVALPATIKAYPIVEARDGFPYMPLDVYQNFIQDFKAANYRFPIYFSVDLRVAKDVKLNPKYALRPSITVRNLTNHFNALDVHANTADPKYGQFFGNYNRHIRIDLDLVY